MIDPQDNDFMHPTSFGTDVPGWFVFLLFIGIPVTLLTLWCLL